MSCIFCESLFHLSKNCESVASVESRRLIILSKNHCDKCLISPNSKHHKCIPKCYACFSDQHSSAFCVEKEMFVPKIDQDLFSRFFHILSLDEKYAMAFTYTSAQNLMNLKPLIFKEILYHLNWFPVLPDRKIMTNGQIMISDIMHYEFYEMLRQNAVINKAKLIAFDHMEDFSAQLFLQLLTPFTKELSVQSTKFDSKVTFCEILQRKN